MPVSVKWLGVIVSASVLTIITFTGLSRFINIDFPPPVSNSNVFISFNKTSTVVPDQGQDTIPKIDVKFMNAAKPPKPNYKRKPPPPCWPPPFDTRLGHFETTEQAIIKPPKPNFEISRNIGRLSITEHGSFGCGGEMPLVKRYAPIMPKYATKSGHCNMRFQLDAKGNYINVKAVSCSEEMFAQPSIRAVQSWQINICASEQEIDTELVRETRITFRLTDENGNIIPE